MMSSFRTATVAPPSRSIVTSIADDRFRTHWNRVEARQSSLIAIGDIVERERSQSGEGTQVQALGLAEKTPPLLSGFEGKDAGDPTAAEEGERQDRPVTVKL